MFECNIVLVLIYIHLTNNFDVHLGVSPDRLPAAGIRTMRSIGDKRLTQPSDNSDYLRPPVKDDIRYTFIHIYIV